MSDARTPESSRRSPDVRRIFGSNGRNQSSKLGDETREGSRISSGSRKLSESEAARQRSSPRRFFGSSNNENSMRPWPKSESDSISSVGGATLHEPSFTPSHRPSTIRRLFGSEGSIKSSKAILESPEDIRGPLGLSLLYEPPETLIDFVFVHGLQGGSRRTWSYSEDPQSYWPKAWLPSQPGFKHIRVHSFGYDSQWATTKDGSLSVDDFSQDLVAHLANSPNLAETPETPIVLIVHSMGGLVAKKAVLIAKLDPKYHHVANRIHTIFFLATPHKGADSANQLKLFMSLGILGSKQFVKELVPGSQTLQIINDQFKHVCSNIELWSFYETLATPPLNKLIVPRENAQIGGISAEHIQMLNADHRHVCKFETPKDRNFVTLCNSFRVTVRQIEEKLLPARKDKYWAEMKLIAQFLEVTETQEIELATEAEKCQQGTCTWLTESPEFQDWLGNISGEKDQGDRDLLTTLRKPKCFWLNGPHGTGKTVIVGYVVNYLKKRNLHSSFFLFKHGGKSRQSLAEVLRGLAFQMAEANPEVRERLLQMVHREERLSIEDHNMIWRTLFVGQLLEIRFSQPQFWIFDALDECNKNALQALFKKIGMLKTKLELRIFLTSLPGGHLERLFVQENLDYISFPLESHHSLHDIELFVRGKWMFDNKDKRTEQLLTDILEKSRGVFMWVTLIMIQLENTYAVEQRQEVLTTLPIEMNKLYTRIAEEISQPNAYDIAKTALSWAVCSKRHITVSELRDAIKMDIDLTLTANDKDLEALCGHLIVVDKQGRLQLFHHTVYSFLTKKTSRLKLDISISHARMAVVCLRHMIETMFPYSSFPRLEKNKIINNPPKISAISEYAAIFFSDHLAEISSSSDEPMELLVKFFEGKTVLYWIEHVAKHWTVQIVIKTAKNLKRYLSSREKHHSPQEENFQLIASWAVDLAHLVAAFGPYLLDSPSSIYFRIPPLCPSSSTIHKSFAKVPKYAVKGRSDSEWSDRLSCFIYQDVRCLDIKDEAFALGLESGEVFIYDSVTLELRKTVNHGEQVDFVAFGTISPICASIGNTKVRLWDAHYGFQWELPLNLRKLKAQGLRFNEDDTEIWIPIRMEEIVRISVRTGTRLSNHTFYRNGAGSSESSDSASDEDEVKRPKCVPNTSEEVRMSLVHDLMAVSYRNSPIVVWELKTRRKACIIEKKVPVGVKIVPGIIDMVFNTNPQLCLLAIGYIGAHGSIEIVNPSTAEVMAKYPILVDCLASSPDGQILATGEMDGTICLFMFQTLQLIYRITDLRGQVEEIIFASNGLRFFDIREGQCNVWEPSALVRSDRFDDGPSQPGSVEVFPTLPEKAMVSYMGDIDSVTAIVPVDKGAYIFTGSQHGNISLYDAAHGSLLKSFPLHKENEAIGQLEWISRSSCSILLSVSRWCDVKVTKFPRWADKDWSFEHILSHNTNQKLIQFLVSEKSLMFLMASDTCDELWDIEKASLVATKMSTSLERQWISHPTSPEELILIEDGKAHVYSWAKLGRVSDETGTSLIYAAPLLSQPFSPWFSRSQQKLCFSLQSHEEGNMASLHVLDTALINTNTHQALITVIHKTLHCRVKIVLGLIKSTLYFLDTKGWVCSMDMKDTKKEEYLRHFFIPFTWQIGSDLVVSLISGTKIVVFGRKGDPIIFHGYLGFDEEVKLA